MPKYIGTLGGGTTPILPAVLNVQYKVKAYTFQASGGNGASTASVQLVDTDGAPITMQWDFNAREGCVRDNDFSTLNIGAGLNAVISGGAIHLEVDYD